MQPLDTLRPPLYGLRNDRKSGEQLSRRKGAMMDEKHLDELSNQNTEQKAGDLSRRDFIATSIAGSVAASIAAAGPAQAALSVVETNVSIKMPDGTCDAAFIHPASGSHPGVLIWPDAFGLRPVMREMAKRLAAEGYSVLVPNP